ncbi:GNAT family N-acetyltransferase [Aminobacter sp. Y103A]|uniref:acetyltransferase n=1 Tax=Aminobacter sp. Y103A TaxID=1870862 RepID=UPI002573A86E|nr:acetyltransferase [Aminobacter sp. SS-2016]BBD37628.1 GNAT family N-acetyltransferase [Aminobacter sp. SS-2016]
MNIRPRVAADNAVLVAIWEDAVRATHHFLGEDDIQFFRPLVRDDYLPAVEMLVAEDSDGKPVGFIGLDGPKVEMLFVSTSQHGKGIGKALIEHVGRLKGPLAVDVNEQNPGGVAFYLKCGFRQVGRSERDGQGKPFPLLHLAQAS